MPTFNLGCKIWHSTFATATWDLATKPVDPPDVISECALLASAKQAFYVGSTFNAEIRKAFASRLLLPSRTDVRFAEGDLSGYHVDIVQVPDDRDFWYQLLWWYDVARGYDNEFRVGVIVPVTAWWSAPPYD